MRKEIIFAIIAGVVFGLIVALGIWRANSAIVDDISTEKTATETPSSPQHQNSTNQLVISEPEENDVVTEDTVELTGITKPSSWIAISAEEEEYTLKSSENGNFNQLVALEPGINRIVVTSFDETSKTEVVVTVVYSSQFGTEQTNEE